MEIKTCPFCGSLAEICLEDRGGERWWRVECTHCGASGGGFSEDEVQGNEAFGNIVKTVEKAVNIWNRRVE